MIKDVVDAGFTVTKEYAGSKASVLFNPGSESYILRVEGTKLTEGMVHRATLDLGLVMEQPRASFDKIQTYFVTFKES